MPTIVDALTAATDALNQATAKVLSFQQQLEQQAAASQQAATTVINQFKAQPLYLTYYVDPSNGVDTNDALSAATPKRTLDAVFSQLNTQGASILLLGDTTLLNRYILGTNIQVLGAQPANTVTGFAPFRRKVSFLGMAENSPSNTIGIMASGLIFDAGSMFTDSIDFALPDIPAGTNIRAHIMSSAFVNLQFQGPTITVGSAAASALIGSFNGGRTVTTISPTLGQGAAGHVFDGIAAGADPNSMWVYSTNLKSA